MPPEFGPVSPSPTRLWACGDALAGGEPVRLDDDRRALGAHEGFRRVRVPEDAVGRGRNPVAPAQVLGEGLRAFQLCGRRRRPEGADPGSRQVVDEAGDKRRLRADDDEFDIVVPAEGGDRAVVAGVEADAGRHIGDARVAGGGVQRFQNGACGKGPGHRVLAPAGADEKDVHFTSSVRPVVAFRLARS